MTEIDDPPSEQQRNQNEVAAGWYIPTLYFVEGLPYTIVNIVSVIMLKNLHFENSQIVFWTSLLYIPWVIKFAWAPFIDLSMTRRKWILVAHVVLAALMIALSLTVLSPAGFFAYILVLLLIAFASATQDVAIDGYYMDALSEKQQAFYVGIRSFAYKVAWLFGSGAMVSLAGLWSELAANHERGTIEGWALSFAVCGALFLLAFTWHLFILPRPDSSGVSQPEDSRPHEAEPSENGLARFVRVFVTFCDQPKIVVAILYILTFRMGDALLLKMAPLFLVDPISKGGLAISTVQVGVIYGTVGTGALMVGGVLGGLLVAKYGLKRCLLPAAVVQNASILLYWVLATFKPDITMVAFANALEQFAYGIGTAAYTVFLLSVVKAEYKAAHYAIATALMALGLVIPGAVSGFLVECMGYQNFFLFSFFCSIPGIICIFYLPIRQHA